MRESSGALGPCPTAWLSSWRKNLFLLSRLNTVCHSPTMHPFRGLGSVFIRTPQEKLCPSSFCNTVSANETILLSPMQRHGAYDSCLIYNCSDLFTLYPQDIDRLNAERDFRKTCEFLSSPEMAWGYGKAIRSLSLLSSCGQESAFSSAENGNSRHLNFLHCSPARCPAGLWSTALWRFSGGSCQLSGFTLCVIPCFLVGLKPWGGGNIVSSIAKIFRLTVSTALWMRMEGFNLHVITVARQRKNPQLGGLFWYLQHWCNSLGDISATRLSSPIHRRDKVQSQLQDLQRLFYRMQWTWQCT